MSRSQRRPAIKGRNEKQEPEAKGVETIVGSKWCNHGRISWVAPRYEVRRG